MGRALGACGLFPPPPPPPPERPQQPWRSLVQGLLLPLLLFLVAHGREPRRWIKDGRREGRRWCEQSLGDDAARHRWLVVTHGGRAPAEGLPLPWRAAQVARLVLAGWAARGTWAAWAAWAVGPACESLEARPARDMWASRGERASRAARGARAARSERPTLGAPAIW